MLLGLGDLGFRDRIPQIPKTAVACCGTLCCVGGLSKAMTNNNSPQSVPDVLNLEPTKWRGLFAEGHKRARPSSQGETMTGNFTCPHCGRDLDYSTRDGWICPIHGQQGVPREIDTSDYPEDTATPPLFEVEG